ncbi:pentapeptide repeat-containing protein [Chloroflexota bacterium]
MGDGTEESPYTREDVLRLIEENGGIAEGLDLAEKFLEDGIDLKDLDLKGIILKNVKCYSISCLQGMIGVLLEKDVMRELDPNKIMSSGAHFENSRLAYANLEGAEFPFSHFEHCDLSRANCRNADLAFTFFIGASLIDANLEGTRLTSAFLEGASLSLAHLEGASLGGVKFSDDTKLGNVDWGNYILGEEKRGAFPFVAETYRRLKQWYTNAGMYDIAGEFYFREMTARRKNFRWGNIPKFINEKYAMINLERVLEENTDVRLEDYKEIDQDSFEKYSKFGFFVFPKRPLSWAWSKLVSLLCGYGERPLRVICWAASSIVGFAIIYFIIGSIWEWAAFWRSLYFSVVSFTALGYGSWVSVTSDAIKALGATESYVGVFMMALFLVTFTRKMTR